MGAKQRVARGELSTKNRYGLNSLSFRGNFLWNTIKDEIKSAGTSKNVEKLIKKWDSNACHFSISIQVFLSFFICFTVKSLFLLLLYS